MTTKVCSKCKVEKDVGEFHSNKIRSGGIDYFCKECRNKYNRKYYSDHLEENKIRSKKYHLEHKVTMKEKNKLKYIENKEKIDALNKKYSETESGRESAIRRNKKYAMLHPDKVKEFSRKYHAKHLPEHAAYASKYRKTPNGKVLESRHRHNRATLMKKTDCTLTLKQWNKILDMQQNKCAVCQCEFSKQQEPTKDHIIPLTLGGGLTFGNVQALCRSCNSRKNNGVYISVAIDALLVEP